jgi:hypothetical protein
MTKSEFWKQIEKSLGCVLCPVGQGVCACKSSKFSCDEVLRQFYESEVADDGEWAG